MSPSPESGFNPKAKVQHSTGRTSCMVREYDREEVPAVYDLRAVETVKEREGYRQVVFRGVDMMLGHTTIEPTCDDRPPHTHPWEQINMLMEGELQFLVDGTVVDLQPHHAMVIPPDVPHAARSADVGATLLAVWPLREDRVEMTQYQREFPV
mgnify:FL=1